MNNTVLKMSKWCPFISGRCQPATLCACTKGRSNAFNRNFKVAFKIKWCNITGDIVIDNMKIIIMVKKCQIAILNGPNVNILRRFGTVKPSTGITFQVKNHYPGWFDYVIMRVMEKSFWKCWYWNDSNFSLLYLLSKHNVYYVFYLVVFIKQ